MGRNPSAASWSPLRRGSLPASSAIAMALAVPLACLGMVLCEAGLFNHEYAAFVAAIARPADFAGDPLMSRFAPSAAPLVLRALGPVYDVPLTHLLGGFAAKLLCSYALLRLGLRVSGSVSVAVVFVLTFVGAADFLLVRLRYHQGFMSGEWGSSAYCSGRQFAFAACILATVAVLDGSYLVAGLLLAGGFALHPLNAIVFLVVLWLAVAAEGLRRGCGAPAARNAALLAGPFLAVAAVYGSQVRGAAFDVAPMSFERFYSLIVLRNEPDDASVLHYVRGDAGLYLGTVANVGGLLWLWILARRSRPASSFSEFAWWMPVRVMLVTWAVILAFLAWETVLRGALPDSLNDVLILFQSRRATTIPCLFGLLFWLEWARRGMSGFHAILRKRVEYRAMRRHPVATWVVLLAGLVLYRGASAPGAVRRLRDLCSLEHRPFVFFDEDRSPYVYDEPGRILSKERFEEISRFVRTSLEPNAHVVTPAYVGRFRAYAQRGATASEKFDGNMAFTSRRFATEYLRQIGELYPGWSYADYEEPVNAGGKPYRDLREIYLGLGEADFRRFRRAHPEFGYVLTESGHALGFPVVHANEEFVLYEIPRADED